MSRRSTTRRSPGSAPSTAIGPLSTWTRWRWTSRTSFDDSANDVRDVHLQRVHVLSGPIAVEGAEPGDLLVVDLLDISPLPQSPWGYTGLVYRTNDGGWLH